MAKLRVRKAFELAGEKTFILAGTIVEGKIEPGMWVNFTAGVSCQQGPIIAVEARPGSEAGDVWLMFACATSEELARWQMMAIRDDILDVFEPPELIIGMD